MNPPSNDDDRIPPRTRRLILIGNACAGDAISRPPRPRRSAKNWVAFPRNTLSATANQYALSRAVCQQRSTTYCGPLLGRTQDVDKCVSLWKRPRDSWLGTRGSKYPRLRYADAPVINEESDEPRDPSPEPRDERQGRLPMAGRIA